MILYFIPFLTLGLFILLAIAYSISDTLANRKIRQYEESELCQDEESLSMINSLINQTLSERKEH